MTTQSHSQDPTMTSSSHLPPTLHAYLDFYGQIVIGTSSENSTIAGLLILLGFFTLSVALYLELLVPVVAEFFRCAPWIERALELQKRMAINVGFKEHEMTFELGIAGYSGVYLVAFHHLLCGLMMTPICIYGWNNIDSESHPGLAKLGSDELYQTLFVLAAVLDVGYDLYDTTRMFWRRYCYHIYPWGGLETPTPFFLLLAVFHHPFAISLVIPMITSSHDYISQPFYHQLSLSLLITGGMCFVFGNYRYSLDVYNVYTHFLQYKCITVFSFFAICYTRVYLWLVLSYEALTTFYSNNDMTFFFVGIIGSIGMSIFNAAVVYDATDSVIKWLPKKFGENVNPGHRPDNEDKELKLANDDLKELDVIFKSDEIQKEISSELMKSESNSKQSMSLIDDQIPEIKAKQSAAVTGFSMTNSIQGESASQFYLTEAPNSLCIITGTESSDSYLGLDLNLELDNYNLNFDDTMGSNYSFRSGINVPEVDHLNYDLNYGPRSSDNLKDNMVNLKFVNSNAIADSDDNVDNQYNLEDSESLSRPKRLTITSSTTAFLESESDGDISPLALLSQEYVVGFYIVAPLKIAFNAFFSILYSGIRNTTIGIFDAAKDLECDVTNLESQSSVNTDSELSNSNRLHTSFSKTDSESAVSSDPVTSSTTSSNRDSIDDSITEGPRIESDDPYSDSSSGPDLLKSENVNLFSELAAHAGTISVMDNDDSEVDIKSIVIQDCNTDRSTFKTLTKCQNQDKTKTSAVEYQCQSSKHIDKLHATVSNVAKFINNDIVADKFNDSNTDPTAPTLLTTVTNFEDNWYSNPRFRKGLQVYRVMDTGSV